MKKILLIIALAVGVFISLAYLQRSSESSLGIAASPNLEGKIAYAASGSIWLYADGKAQKLTDGPKDKLDKHDAQPWLSADGTEIVYTRFDEGFSDLYKLNISNPAKMTALTQNKPQADTGGYGYATAALWAMQPAWSPDGDKIAYTSDVRTQYPGIFTMDTEGDSVHKVEYLDHSIQAVEHHSWSPDGRKIAVASYLTASGKGQIWSFNLASSKWTELTTAKNGAYDPAWSPDGEWIAFTMRDEQDGTTNNIYVIPTDAQKWEAEYPTPIQLTTDGVSRAPAWSPDGTRLAYISLKDGSFDIQTAHVDFDALGNPSLQNSESITEKANVDPTSGLSWGK